MSKASMPYTAFGQHVAGLTWHAVVAIVILLIPSFVLGLPPGELMLRNYYVSVLFAGGYIGSVVLLTTWMYFQRALSIFEFSLFGLAALSFVYFNLLFLLPDVVSLSHSVALASTIVIATSTVAFLVLRRWPWILTTVAVILGVSAASLNYFTIHDERHLPMVTSTSASTSLYLISAKAFRNRVPQPVQRGGGFTRVADATYLATGDGRLFDVVTDENFDISLRQLPFSVPINFEAFLAAATPGTDETRFRVTDIAAHIDNDDVRLFAAHHYWKANKNCFVLRISEIKTKIDDLSQLDSTVDWVTLFDTEPCLKLHEFGSPFAGHVAGGRLAVRPDGKLLLSTGDHDWNGFYATPALSQLHDSSYGKIIEIDTTNGDSRNLTMGHKNPQGLVVRSDESIWSTEHAMDGGDELNLIVEGANYGWPYVSYSTDYGSYDWPLNESQGRHDGFEYPMFSWLPSIAISDLIEIRGELFDEWRGDLVIGSLVGGSLFRVRSRENRVVAIERMRFSDTVEDIFRIRDIEETQKGNLLLWLDSATIVSLYPSVKPTSGKELFAANCSACHSIGNGTQHGIGPDLNNIVRREIASAPGFDFSPALVQLNGAWTKQKLGAYLADPSGVAPGTSMVFPGVADKDARNAIIGYLTSPE